MKKDLKCYLSPLCALKMKYYIDSTNLEISGIGKSHFDEDNNIVIDDIIIYKQKCTGSTTKLDTDDVAKVQFEQLKNGEDSGVWNVWWHSHANMSVFWSTTDEDNICAQANNSGLYMVSIVSNKKGDYKTRFDIFPKDCSPFKKSVYYKYADDIPTEVLTTKNDPERKKELEDLLDEEELKIKDKEDRVSEIANKTIKLFAAEVNKKKNEYFKDVEDSFDINFGNLIKEYSSLSGVLLDDLSLKNSIKSEVDEKVTTEIVERNSKGSINVKRVFNKKYDNGYSDIYMNDYDDGVYGGVNDESLFNNDDDYDELDDENDDYYFFDGIFYGEYGSFDSFSLSWKPYSTTIVDSFWYKKDEKKLISMIKKITPAKLAEFKFLKAKRFLLDKDKTSNAGDELDFSFKK